jgi:hypothetical protein
MTICFNLKYLRKISDITWNYQLNPFGTLRYILVGGTPTPLKILVSWDYYDQYMESHKIHVPNHQPVYIYAHIFQFNMPSISTLNPKDKWGKHTIIYQIPSLFVLISSKTQWIQFFHIGPVYPFWYNCGSRIVYHLTVL